MAAPETSSKPTPIQRLLDRRKQAAGVCFLKAAVLAGVAIWVGVTWGKSLAPVWLWSGSIAVLALAAGLWLLIYETPDGAESKELDEMRLMVLSIGGLAGLLTVCLGLVLGYVWWSDILAWMQPGGAVRTGTSKEQWRAGLRALLPMPILLAGLAVMFASLQLARTDERNRPILRRLFHGYNAVLTSLLLLLVLVVANVFVGVKLQKPLDFTSSNMFTLSDRSINILKHLEQPVKVFVITRSSNSPDALATQAMLVNCREVNEQFQMETISENRNVNPETLDELRQKVPDLSEGMVVRYGPKDKAEYRLIKAEDLISQEGARGSPRFEFKGEDALMTQLTSLSEGKQKPMLYFVQGHGELDLKDSNPRSQTGAGALKKRLEERNFEVKPLSIDAPDAKVPADATMVVIAGPRNPLSDYALKALDEYMGKGGKLIVLIGPTLNRERTEMVKTGLEPFLAKYNVRVGNDRVLSLPNRNLPQMTDLIATTNRQVRDNPLFQPLVQPFEREPIILLGGSRSVQPAPSRPGMTAQFQGETLLTNYSGIPVWEESNLSASPNQLYHNYRQNNVEVLEKKLKTALPLAVGVAEMTGPPPNPHTFMQPPAPTAQKPRLIVIGNATLASNLLTNARGAQVGYEFLASSVEWLREKPERIGIEPKKHQFYALPATASFWPFVLMPTALILFGVVGLGTGVWLVRRR